MKEVYTQESIESSLGMAMIYPLAEACQVGFETLFDIF